jgi:integrase/recombinase XerD
MRSSPVSLYLRVRSPEGGWLYARSVTASNGRIRPLHALINGKPVYRDEGVYHLRYSLDGKRIWQPIGSDASLAQVALQRKTVELQAVNLGLAVPELILPELATPEPVSSPAAKTNLRESIAEYLADTAAGKSRKTLYAYTRTLNTFASVCPKQYLEQIDRRDILNYIAHLRRCGNVPRTVANRVDFLHIFFNHKKISWPLEKTDRIKYTEKIVSSYQPEEITKLLAAADQEESEIFQFFLFTGSRDQEVQYATWRDVDFSAKTFTVSEKLDLQWSPKDSEEGSIPIPDSLVEALQNRRKRYPGTRLIFPTTHGKPNGHFLRGLKRLAFRTGMNCGHCYNKVGQCCATKPVCKRFELHRFRKTFATMHHEAGVPVRTISRWLRHSDLETTLRYLAASDDKSEKTRAQVNNTFAAFATTGGAAVDL